MAYRGEFVLIYAEITIHESIQYIFKYPKNMSIKTNVSQINYIYLLEADV